MTQWLPHVVKSSLPSSAVSKYIDMSATLIPHSERSLSTSPSSLLLLIRTLVQLLFTTDTLNNLLHTIHPVQKISTTILFATALLSHDQMILSRVLAQKYISKAPPRSRARHDVGRASQDVPFTTIQGQPKAYRRTQGAIYPSVVGGDLDAEHGVDWVSPCLFAEDALQFGSLGEGGVNLEGREATGPVVSGEGEVLSQGLVFKRDYRVDRVLDFEDPVKLTVSVSVLRALLSDGIYAMLAYKDTRS